MVSDKKDGRSGQAKAYQWAMRIMTVSLEMVVPGLLGYALLDRNLGTKGLFTLLGFGLGMTMGIFHLVKMTSGDAATNKKSEDTTNR